MANNRMYLVNQRLGIMARIGTYRLNAPGWEPVPDVAERMALAFKVEAEDGRPHPGQCDWVVLHEGSPVSELRADLIEVEP